MPYSKYSSQEVLNGAYDDVRGAFRFGPLMGSLKGSSVSVSTTAVALPSTAYAKRGLLVIRPLADIYIGGSDVTTATGFLVPANTTFELEVSDAVVVYAIAAAPVTVKLLEVA